MKVSLDLKTPKGWQEENEDEKCEAPMRRFLKHIQLHVQRAVGLLPFSICNYLLFGFEEIFGMFSIFEYDF